MRSCSSHIKLTLFILLFFSSMSLFAQQWKKPLASNREFGAYADAKVNVGIVFGPTATAWIHPNTNTEEWHLQQYTIRPSYGIYHDDVKDTTVLCFFGGLALEYMLTPAFSVGMNVIYSQRATGLYYKNENFPCGIGLYSTKEYSLFAIYKSLELLIPLTYYIKIPSLQNFKPFLYAAPKASYVLGGNVYYYTKEKEKPNGSIKSKSQQSTPIGKNNYVMYNAGVTVGVGTLFRIETSSYYSLLKFDFSANYNLIQTFSKKELENEFNRFRFSVDAEFSITYMLPIKKILKDACYYFD